MARMLTISRHLENARDSHRKFADGSRFALGQTFFGFRDLEHLSDMDLTRTKGWPCVATEKGRGKRQIALKVLPMSKSYSVEDHPVKIESRLLSEFSKLTRTLVTPHIPQFLGSFDAPNNCKALTAFPLKKFRKKLQPHTHVLAAEFVSGGSVEEWTSEVPRSVEDWRYVLFSIAWTLLVLQDKYGCVHSDLHYGNVLIHPVAPSPVTYQLISDFGDAPDLTFSFKTPAFIPKIWDWELSSCFDESRPLHNPLCMPKDYFPNDMNPHYDLHCFMTSLLEERVQAPPEITKLVLDLYPPELVPSDEVRAMFDGSTCRTTCVEGCGTCENCHEGGEEEAGRNDQVHEHSDHSDHSEHSEEDESDWEDDDSDLYYKTDESQRTSTASSLASEPSRSSGSSHCGRSMGSHKRLSNNDGCDIRTEFLFNDRLLRGATDNFSKVPTPITLLLHPFFDVYRQPKSSRGTLKGPLFRHVRE